MSQVRLRATVAGLMLVAGCASTSTEPDTEGVGAMAHIHGIGVDPADGTLFAATHTGLFRIDGKQATRVAGRWQDTMAFTVVGEHHFLASGHPGAGDDRPVHLGLIESTDAGQTWKSVALEGEADFHALEVAGPAVYGYDSLTGTLMQTRDRRTFRPIAALALADIAADPADDDRLLATTQDGLVAIDASGGKQTKLSSPSLVFIDWPEPDLLVGLSEDGRVHVSDDGGTTWTSRGSVPGAPAAIEITGDSWYAASDRGLFKSTDGGAIWKRTGPPMHGN